VVTFKTQDKPMWEHDLCVYGVSLTEVEELYTLAHGLVLIDFLWLSLPLRLIQLTMSFQIIGPCGWCSDKFFQIQFAYNVWFFSCWFLHESPLNVHTNWLQKYQCGDYTGHMYRSVSSSEEFWCINVILSAHFYVHYRQTDQKLRLLIECIHAQHCRLWVLGGGWSGWRDKQ